MTKKLKGQSSTLSELHFVSDLPLEGAVRLVGNLATETRKVILTEIDSNTFSVQVIDNKSDRDTRIKGKLRRWQGTETRVDCNAYVGLDYGRFAASSLAGFFMTFCFLLLTFVSSDNFIVNASAMTLILLLIISSLGGVMFGWIAGHFIDRDSMNARGDLLETLMKQFQSAGNVQWVSSDPHV